MVKSVDDTLKEGDIVYAYGAPQHPGKVIEFRTKGENDSFCLIGDELVVVKFLNGKEKEFRKYSLRHLESHIREIKERLARHKKRLKKAKEI